MGLGSPVLQFPSHQASFNSYASRGAAEPTFVVQAMLPETVQLAILVSILLPELCADLHAHTVTWLVTIVSSLSACVGDADGRHEGED